MNNDKITKRHFSLVKLTIICKFELVKVQIIKLKLIN